MAARAKEFEFEMPLVKKVSQEAVSKVLKVGKSAASPTTALKRLMAGKSVLKPNR